jgi:CheY-like chemotaxis protein
MSEHKPGPASGGKWKILIVDDSTDSARMFALLLSLQGHDVRVAHDGTEALACAASFLPDAAFLDIRLPGMDGYELARRLRQIPTLADVLLTAVTGFGDDDDLGRAREAGFDHHLLKPADPEAVKRILAGHGGRER